MRVIGLDPSLTATGYAGPPNETGSGVLRPPSDLREAARLRWLRDGLVAMCAIADLVVIEGIALASQGAYRSEQAGLGWLIRVGLFELGVPYVDVPPSTLKVFATGKGRHEGRDAKAMVLTEAVRRLGYAGSSHDEADALWLRMMGLVHYELPGAIRMPASHTRTIATAVKWPVPKQPAAMELPL